MHIHRLLRNEDDRYQLFWELARWTFDPLVPVKVWRDEDLPVLTPLFEFQAGERKMSDLSSEQRDEVIAGLDRWEKAKTDYADALFAQRNAVAQFGIHDLADIFGYELVCAEGADSVTVTVEESVLKTQIKSTENLEYPVVIVAFLESGWDRQGDYSLSVVDYVSLYEMTEGAADAGSKN